MKRLRAIAVMLLCMWLMICVTSCVVSDHQDNGNHYGWQKNANNPHNANSTNPGKSNK